MSERPAATDALVEADRAAQQAIDDVLGPGGALAKALPGWESRPSQWEMARLVGTAIRSRQHAVIEAPTGTGKSFAYLVPLIQQALAGGRPVVVSTGTIALQEQLMRKDIPQLQHLFPELRAVLVKGRQNYLSRRRLDYAHGGQQRLAGGSDEDRAIAEIAAFARTAALGDLAELGFQPPPGAWRRVQSDRGNCLGRRCPTFDTCFFYNARREMEQAHLLVVNHHLYFSDLGLREADAAILPPHDVVVFDEAHQLEDVATDHLGLSLSEAQVRYHLDGLHQARSPRCLLADDRLEPARAAVDMARGAAERFWAEITRIVARGSEPVVRIAGDTPIENVLSPALEALARALNALEPLARDDHQRQELKAQADRSAGLAGSIAQLLDTSVPDMVHFAESGAGRAGVVLSAAPLAVGPVLKERLFDTTGSVVLTSATLAADDSERFLFLRRRLGLDGGLARRLESPFDYPQQARLLLNRTAIDPNGPDFEARAARWIASYLATDEGRRGGAFVLFTSFRQLQAVHDLCRPALDAQRRSVLRHGDRMPRDQMLDLFRRSGDAVLFGTTSFWEGVDVPGDALRHVIIAKLPFEVPSHPVTQARHQQISARGGNAFMERSVPEAILRLKQGFGRLIRTRADSGTVAILDHRVLSKTYGRYFLRALPACPVTMIDL